MKKKTPDLFEGSPAILRVALCQVRTEPWDLEGNLSRTLAAIEEAKAGGAEVAITPECVLHGYPSGSGEEHRARTREAAELLEGPRLSRVRERARALGIDVVLGFAERGNGGAVHNAAALVTREGEVASIYRKVHLRPFEDASGKGPFSAGDRFEAVERRYGGGAFRVGLMICFDREVPEPARCLRALGAELVACPIATATATASPAPEGADNELVTRCRAAENELFIAIVNHAGRFNGRSYVAGPGGEVLGAMGEGPGVGIVDVPVGILREKFHGKPFGWMGWGFRRPEVYARYLGAPPAGP